MNETSAREFVESWLQAWNAHDLDEVLAHFSTDVTFTSPVAAHIITGSQGVVRGQTALREYWQEGLRRIPNLRFELVDFYVGVDTIVINYRNQNGGLVNEVLRFADSLVVEGHGTYLAVEPDPTRSRSSFDAKA
jgi:ketosteroid isomerase-like protein